MLSYDITVGPKEEQKIYVCSTEKQGFIPSIPFIRTKVASA